VKRPEITGHSNQLGTIASELFLDEICRSHLDQPGCDR
jgi:hypothetical protein